MTGIMNYELGIMDSTKKKVIVTGGAELAPLHLLI